MALDALFKPFEFKSLKLPNRVVMAPMTRSFSPGGVATDDVAAYYARRAAAQVACGDAHCLLIARAGDAVRVSEAEAAVAAANGLSTEEALSAITIDAARILGIEKRVGSLEVGKDGDVALYDGDPFEYLTHCTGTIIQGRLVSSDRN